MKLVLFFIIFFKTVHSRRFYLLLCLFLINLTAFADESFKINYKQCWKYGSDKITNIQPIIVANNLILSLSDATLTSLDLANGTVNWRAELGGKIAAEPISNGKIVVVATLSTLSESANQEEFLTIRALSSATGLTIWQKNFNNIDRAILSSNSETFLLIGNSSENSSKLTLLSFADGAASWSKNVPSAVTTNIFLTRTEIYFGSKDGTIQIVRTADGETLKQIKIKSASPLKLTAADGVIFFDDGRGEVKALRQIDERQIWTLRTGGAVQNILPTKQGLLATSLDNFVYLQKYSNGKRIWRRRLAARPLAAALIDNETALLLTNGENTAAVIELKKGKILNQFSLGDENYPVADPVFADKFVFVPTFQGIMSFAPTETACGETSEAEKEKSAK